jgi:hypothetical protein
MSSTQTSFFDSLVAAVRENPLAAALVGGGAFWLLTGNDRLKSAASSATAAVSPLVDAGTRNLRAVASKLEPASAPPTAPELDQDGSFRVGAALRDTASAASDAMSEAADKVRGHFDDGVAFAKENLSSFGNPLPGKETFKKAQSSLTDVLERQPLALGVVGLAIGAAVAGAFRTLDIENQSVGELSDTVKADLNRRAGAVSQSLGEASDSLKAELGDIGAEAIDRLKQAGIDAAGAAREKAKSP